MDNYSLVGLSLVISASTYLLLKILCKNQIKHHLLLEKVANKIYEFIVFFLAIAFYYHFVLVLQNDFISSDNKESILVIVLLSVCLIIASIIVASQVLSIFSGVHLEEFKSSNQNYSFKYVGYYLLLMVGIQLVLQVSICYQLFYFVYVAAILFILLMLGVIIKRPYKHPLHNFGLLLNLSVLGFNFGWIIAEQLFKQMMPYRMKLTMALASGLALVSLMAVIRLLLTIKREWEWRK